MASKTKEYTIKKINFDPENITESKIWDSAAHLRIENYLWLDNGYKPGVEIKALHSSHFIYIFFKVFEKKIKAQFTRFGDPVYKDSCVEFFLNPFPEKSDDYFNFEMNAIGALLVGVGAGRNRRFLQEQEARDFEIIPSIKSPVNGFHGADFWTIHLKIPVRLFEEHYKMLFSTPRHASGNFYKCGDETEFEHYGAWNRIDNPTPDFHLAKYFGKIVFSD
ncbi:MAG: hypothetical protein GWP06_10335 [Actinobacteria bacterium]|nr:hypothetical protein [Actinomycetota bacterium]